MAAFDPYRKWLGIPEESRPPTHYQLLGISPQEKDPEVIDAAVIRQSAYVRNFQSGKYGDDAARILTEISAAKACLTDAGKRAAYDAELRKKQPPAARPAATNSPGGRPAGSRPAGQQPAPRPMHQQMPVAVAPRFDPLLEQAALGTAYAPLHPAFQVKRRQSIPPWQLAVAGGLAIAAVVVVGIVVGMLMNDDPAVAEVAPVVGEGSSDAATSGTDAATNGIANNGASSGTPGVVGGAPPTNSSGPGSSVAANNTSGAAENSATSTGSDNDPPSSSTPRPRSTASPGFDWGENARLSISAAGGSVPIFSRGYTPFVAVAGEVWHLETGESVGKLDEQPERLKLAALSPNGRYFAAPREAFPETVELWDTQTGRKLHNMTCDADGARPIAMEFSDDEHIIIGWEVAWDGQVQLWNAVEGEGVVWFNTARFDADDFAVSPDGKYVAVATSGDGILIYDVRKKKRVATAMPPPDDGGNRRLHCDGLRFAPDGLEIAAVEERGQHIMVWNGKAELVFEHRSATTFRAPSGGVAYEGPAIEWLPNGAGWLLNGHFVLDRESEQIVMVVEVGHWDREARAKFLSEGQLIATRGQAQTRELVSIDIPWEKIRNSLAAADTQAARNMSVGLDLQLSELLASTPQTATTELTRIVTARLQEEGMRTGASEAGVLLASYSESIENRRVAQLDGMGRPIRGPGGMVSVTVGNLDLAFTPAGSDEPQWEVNVVADSGGNAAGAPSGNLFHNLATKLNGTLLPSFLAATDDMLPLPIIADLQ